MFVLIGIPCNDLLIKKKLISDLWSLSTVQAKNLINSILLQFFVKFLIKIRLHFSVLFIAKKNLIPRLSVNSFSIELFWIILNYFKCLSPVMVLSGFGISIIWTHCGVLLSQRELRFGPKALDMFLQEIATNLELQSVVSSRQRAICQSILPYITVYNRVKSNLSSTFQFKISKITFSSKWNLLLVWWQLPSP